MLVPFSASFHTHTPVVGCRSAEARSATLGMFHGEGWRNIFPCEDADRAPCRVVVEAMQPMLQARMDPKRTDAEASEEAWLQCLLQPQGWGTEVPSLPT